MNLRRFALSSACLLVLSLTGCGFHPRAELEIPADLGPVLVVGSDPYSPLADNLSRALTRAGAQPAAVVQGCSPAATGGSRTPSGPTVSATVAAPVDDAATACALPAGGAAATLKIASESWNQGPLTVDTFSRVREYLITYRVKFSFTAADGTDIVPSHEAKVQRDFTYDASHALGSSEEQDTIRQEMQRDMAASIIRSMGIALRNYHH